MKTNLVIHPSVNFLKKSNEFNNLFVDRYTYDQYEAKNPTDSFYAGKLDSKYRTNNFNLSDILFYEILDCIKTELNLILEKKFDQNFYEIIIGSWLRKFIQQFVLKYKNIIEIKKKFNLKTVTTYNTNSFNFFTSETHTIQHATLNNLWNSCVYSYILNELNLNIELTSIQTPEKNFDDNEYLNYKTTNNSKKFIKKIIYNILVYFSNLLPNNADFFMYSTGINYLDEKKIDLIFGQMPRFYPQKFEFKYSNYDPELRKKFNFEKYIKVNNNIFEKDFIEIFNLIMKILHKSLPIFFIEDFERLLEFSYKKTNFPKSPKAICTSFAFEGNEPFKFYLATKKFYNPKIKYFVYQHGGSYITRIDNNFSNEFNTCDYFITWGDINDITKKNNIKFVNFKLLNKKYMKTKKTDKLLILMRSSGYNAVPYDRYSEGLNEINQTVKLCKNFSYELKKNTVIRAHYSSKNRIQNQIKELQGFKIDYSEENYFDAINKAKIVLFNHDSTGMLEMFTLNKPTLCLWSHGDQHLNSFVLDDYEMLKKAKILFNNYTMLNEHLENIWNDPLKWWYSNDVQINLKKFIKLYTKKPDKKFNIKFKNIIKASI